MNECKYVEEQMLNFLYDLLDDNERQKVKNHLKKCNKCREKIKKLLKIFIIIKTSPGYKPPYMFEHILNTSKKELKKRFLRNLLLLTFIRKMSLKLRIAIISLFLFIASVIIFFIVPKNDYLYIIRASGDVKINNKILSNEMEFKYPLKKTISINTRNGQIILQINKQKLVLLKNNTDIKIETSNNVNIKFLKGILIGKVYKNNNVKKLTLSSDNAKFKITGTLFFIKKIDNSVEFGVKEGNVESIIQDKQINITPDEKLKISNDKITITKINQNENNLFSELNDVNVIKDFNQVRKIYLNTIPTDCQVYFKDINIGNSPLFFLVEKNINESIYVTKSNFPINEIKISGKNDYVIDFVLKKSFAPQISSKFKLKNLVFSNPLYIEGFIVIADSKGNVYKINLNDGKIIWEFKTTKRINSIPTYKDNVIYISSTDNFIYAIDFKTGALKWKRKTGALIYSAPVIYKNKLYLCNSEGEIFCLSTNGDILWHKKFDKGFFSTPAITNDNLFIGGLSGNFYSINLKSMKLNWIFKCEKRIVSSPVIKDSLIFFGSNDKYFYAIDINSGKLKWKFLTNGEIFTSPFLYENMLLIATINGTVYSFDYKTGILKYKFDTNDKILNTPSLINDKYIGIQGENIFYIINKYGVYYTKINIQSTSFTITFDKKIFICGKNKYLYEISTNL